MIELCEVSLPCLLIPEDTVDACFRIVRREEGPDWLLCNEQLLARSHSLANLRPCALGTLVRRSRRDYPVKLLLAAAFNEASACLEDWQSFSYALRALLRCQSRWSVLCESACDESNVPCVDLSIEGLLDRLDGLRRPGYGPMAFQGTCCDVRARSHRGWGGTGWWRGNTSPSTQRPWPHAAAA